MINLSWRFNKDVDKHSWYINESKTSRGSLFKLQSDIQIRVQNKIRSCNPNQT
jgi:hypothetical protein